MKKGDVTYIVFANNGEVLELSSIDNLFRHDIKLIIKRTFFKTSSGQGLYNYFSNEVLDENMNIVPNNTFKWNNITCKLTKDEAWRDYTGNKDFSVCIIFDVEDHFQVENTYSVTRELGSPFKKVINTLELIDKVGSHQGVIEVRNLEKKIHELKVQVFRKSKLIEKLKKGKS